MTLPERLESAISILDPDKDYLDEDYITHGIVHADVTGFLKICLEERETILKAVQEYAAREGAKS